jgi:adenylate cyclase
VSGSVITVVVLAVLVLALVDALVSRIRLGRAHKRIQVLQGELQAQTLPRSRRVARTAVKAITETATRVRESGVTGMLMSSIEDITRWATEDRAQIVKIAAPDGTVTIFFSDIEDSTAHNERLGDDDWVRLLDVHDRLVREQIRRHRGHVVKTQGDGFMVVFRDPVEAVRAAIDIQRGLDGAGGRHLRRTPIRVRIGVHTGTVVSRDGDYFGRNVAMAARVAGQADGGEIVVSDDVRAAVIASDEFELTPVETIELKGLSGSHQLWDVEWAA